MKQQPPSPTSDAWSISIIATGWSYIATLRRHSGNGGWWKSSGGGSKVPGDNVQDSHTGRTPVLERGVGGHGRYDDGTGIFSPQDCQTNCWDEGAEGCRRVMGVGLSGSGSVGARNMSNEGVREEAKGNHCVVCHGSACLPFFYRGR